MRTGVRHVISVLAAVAIAMTSGTAVAGSSRDDPATDARGGSRPTNGFSRSGPWNTRLPEHVPLAANSAGHREQHPAGQGEQLRLLGGQHRHVLGADLHVGRHTPRRAGRSPTASDLPELAPVIADSLAAVPTPPDLIASQGTDAAVAIYQPSTDTYWDFWRAEKDAAGNWSACWGGKIEHYSRQPGDLHEPARRDRHRAAVRRVPDQDRGAAPGPHRPRAQHRHRPHPGGLPLLAGRPATTATPRAPTSRARASASGSTRRSTSARCASPAARTIARAMQEYGLIMTDKGGALVTYAEDPRPYMARQRRARPVLRRCSTRTTWSPTARRSTSSWARSRWIGCRRSRTTTAGRCPPRRADRDAACRSADRADDEQVVAGAPGRDELHRDVVVLVDGRDDDHLLVAQVGHPHTGVAGASTPPLNCHAWLGLVLQS